MQYDDSDLIQQTLEGNQQAFAALVEKYQKQIHALAWQKIGDSTLRKRLRRMRSLQHSKSFRLSQTIIVLRGGSM